MNINRAYLTELDPNNVQRTLLTKSAGTARFAYNWGLEIKKEIYLLNQLPTVHVKYPTAIDLHRQLNEMKKTDFAWMYEVSKCAPQEALRNLDRAFINFFKGRAKYPKSKTKKGSKISFGMTGSIIVTDKKIQLPRIGKVRLKEYNYLPTDTKILSTTVSENSGHWFVSISVEEDIQPLINQGEVAGLDWGINCLGTVSDGVKFKNPKSLSHYERKLKRQQKETSRRIKGSNNRKKSVQKLSRIHTRIANVRKDAIHKLTTLLAKTKSVIVIEDLNVEGMLKNHCFAKSISDASPHEVRRQLEYKTVWYGSTLITADPFFPSSKMCSGCGNIKKELDLSERIYNCEKCHLKIDRDLNAAINLSRLAASSAESENACLSGCIEEAPVIQELNTIEEEVLNG